MKLPKKISSYIKYVFWFCIVASPVILLAMQSLKYHANAFMSHPVWSDEVFYWRLLYSIRESGFNFGHTEGFYGNFEGIGSFGSHGISTLFSYGWYILLFPMRYNSITIANVLCLCAAFLVFVCLVRPDPLQSALIMAVAVTFQPIALYLGTSMMEMPCYAALILYFSLFVRICRKKLAGDRIRWWAWTLLILMGVWAGCLRICYVIVLLPAVFMLGDFKLRKKFFLSLAGFIVGAVALYFVETLFMAEYPFGYLYSLSGLGLGDKLASLWKHFFASVRNYLIFEDTAPTALRYLQLGLLGMLLIQGITALRKKETGKAYVLLSGCAAGLGLIAAICLLYDIFDWRDYRTFAPVVFLLILTLILCCEKQYLSHVCLLIGLYLVFTRSNSMHFISPERCAPVQVNAQAVQQMDAMLENEKCDMAITCMPWDIAFFSAVPPRIGITYLAAVDEVYTCRAKYLVVGHGTEIAELEQYEYLGEIDGYGAVYRLRE